MLGTAIAAAIAATMVTAILADGDLLHGWSSAPCLMA